MPQDFQTQHPPLSEKKHLEEKNLEIQNLETGLRTAARYGNVETVRSILKSSKDEEFNLNSVDSDGKTALHLAAIQGKFKVATILVNAGIDIEAKNFGGRTALHESIHNKHTHLASYLIGVGAKLEAIDNSCNTALHIAAMKDQLEITKFLLNAKAKVDAENDQSMRPLHYLSNNDNVQKKISIAKLLIEADANLHAKDKNGNTPLHIAILRNNLEFTNFLIDNKADVNVCNYKKENPLHSSVESYYISSEIIKLLIEKGINIDNKNRDGKTAYDTLVQYKCDTKELMDLLKGNDTSLKLSEDDEVSPIGESLEDVLLSSSLAGGSTN